MSGTVLEAPPVDTDTPPVAPPTGGTMRRRPLPGGPLRIGVWGPPILVLAAVFGLWYFLSLVVLGERNFLLPPPHEVFGVFGTEKIRTDIFEAFLSTMQVALVGLLIASAIGIVWAIAMNVGALGRALDLSLRGHPAGRPDPRHRRRSSPSG